jgi:hypothetical protein
MQPHTGGRFSLQLRDADAQRARYALTVATAGAEWASEAVVFSSDGRIELAPCRGEGEPPPWLLHYARAALRSTWRAHAEQGWPRRITRWRDAPARAEGPGSES